MKTISSFNVFILVFGFVLHNSFAAFQPEQDHCVQYRAWKTLFLVKKEEILGTNCKISGEMLKGELGPVLRLQIPVEQFQSGNSSRDEDVKSILKYAEHPVMRFESGSLDIPEFKAAVLSEEEIDLSGRLRIGGVEHAVTFKVRAEKHGSKILLNGVMETTFSHFQIPPPKVLGGLVSSAEDKLELRVVLNSEKIQNATGFFD